MLSFGLLPAKYGFPDNGTMTNQGFWNDQSGQDIVEYALLLAMVCLASAALFMLSGASVSTIWHVNNNSLSAARSAAS
jgi:Flp pilus assembly pilin Flp